MAAVYEIDGRLLVRTVNNCGGVGIEDEYTVVVEPFPDVGPEVIGEAVQAALARCRDVPCPGSWPAMRDYARPLLELSPRRYSSYQSWQRAARHVSVVASQESIRAERLSPDIGQGGWKPWPAAADAEFAYEVVLAPEVGPAVVGKAVVKMLEAPPLDGASTSL